MGATNLAWYGGREERAEELTMARECWRPMIVATRKESLSFLPKKGGKGRSCLQGGEGMHRNFHW
jgi:hypothetical protein